MAQLITLKGSLDIDDFILNLFGALVGVIICKNTPICSLFTKRAY
jgi:glycopeptide antibiotics resistance protein